MRRSPSRCSPSTAPRSPRRPRKLAGVSRVLVIDNPANEHALAAVLAPQVAAIAGPYSLVLGASTTFGKDLMPRVAALLDAPQI